MKKNTREDLLEQAEALFAKNGFYGTSINDIAKRVGVSKQALLHHFPSKEKLYSAVLQNATDYLVDFVENTRANFDSPKAQITSILQQMSSATGKKLQVIILLMRELLDNRDRAQQAHIWPLRPFLDGLLDIVMKGQEKGELRKTSPLALIYHLLGATQYYVISLPTLAHLCSEDEINEHEVQHFKLVESLLIE